MDFSTIAAISTPPGKGGVAVIRISGNEAFQIAQNLILPKNGKALLQHPFRYQIYADILSSDKKTILDDGLVTCFQAPFSFTGEDVVEIACHGGEVITSMILSGILESGAVLAKPGEFSRRSFINGKMSLTAAEGVADLLDAKTQEAALLSSKVARGKLSDEIQAIADLLLAVSSSLWAYLDYPEEDLQTLDDQQMTQSLDSILSRCENLLNSFKMGRAINSGIPAAIVGKPNVGKSTFFNRLLGEDRAIVTAVPGTTRDVIEYPLQAGRVLINLSDTAGVRLAPADCVEEIGIERTLAAIEDSELIFALFDLSRPLEEDDKLILDRLVNTDSLVIPVLTKNDLPEKLDRADLPFSAESFFITEKEQFDFQKLISIIELRFISDEAALKEGRILANARQKSSLVKGMDLVLEAKGMIQNAQKDIASLTLESALASFLEIDGKSAGEKILDEVFSRFCIGK